MDRSKRLSIRKVLREFLADYTYPELLVASSEYDAIVAERAADEERAGDELLAFDEQHPEHLFRLHELALRRRAQLVQRASHTPRISRRCNTRAAASLVQSER